MKRVRPPKKRSRTVKYKSKTTTQKSKRILEEEEDHEQEVKEGEFVAFCSRFARIRVRWLIDRNVAAIGTIQNPTICWRMNTRWIHFINTCAAHFSALSLASLAFGNTQLSARWHIPALLTCTLLSETPLIWRAACPVPTSAGAVASHRRCSKLLFLPAFDSLFAICNGFMTNRVFERLKVKNYIDFCSIITQHLGDFFLS